MMQRIAMNLGLRWLGKQAREIAEGKKGPAAQRAYLWLIGKKRAIGTVLALLTVGLMGAGQSVAAQFITGTLSAAFLSLGAIDANWRDIPKLDSAWLRFLRDHAMDVSAVLAIATAALSQCSPALQANLLRIGITCDQGTMILAALTAILAHLGISAEAQSSRPPALGL